MMRKTDTLRGARNLTIVLPRHAEDETLEMESAIGYFVGDRRAEPIVTIKANHSSNSDRGCL